MGLKIQIETYGLGKHRAAVLTQMLEVARASPAWEEGDEVIIMAALTHMFQ